MEDVKKSTINMIPASPIPSKHKDRKERKNQKMIMLRKNEHKVKNIYRWKLYETYGITWL